MPPMARPILDTVLRSTAGSVAASATSRRAFHNTIAARALKESGNHSDNSEKVSEHVEDHHAKVRRGEQHWKEELASDSESAVKAERDSAADRDAPGSKAEKIERMQRETKGWAESKKD
ncbi:MAG: hypothetical protein M1825_000388 [Sarcosagium campestre]|nr:MAG: hypothetical protein M1825_000388 [Sarcosagium campestre]